MFFKRAKKEHAKGGLSDEALVKSYRQNGDMAVLGELYQRYTGLVFGVCMKYLKNEDDSKDPNFKVVQEPGH